MTRIGVLGVPGAGKTTLARDLSKRLGLVHIELDALFHLPGWTPCPTDRFVAAVQGAVDSASPGWVMCGGYQTAIGPIRDARADTLIWLDFDRAVTMRRVIWRTARRSITREELWNGNREPLSNFTRWDPEKNVMRWSWTHHQPQRARYEAKLASGDWDHLAVHRLRSPREVTAFLAEFT